MATKKKALQAAAGQAGAGGAALNVEDVFSTYLYTGNGSTQTITNGIDLDGEGGLVWLKARSETQNHALYDTERGATKLLSSSSTGAEGTLSGVSAFNSNGFNLGSFWNSNNQTYASWTFRKAPKFFDVVTYTGDGTDNRAIAHNLGSVPGCVIVKKTNSTSVWSVYHRSLTSYEYVLQLESTAAEANQNRFYSDPDASNFYLTTSGNVNGDGDTYVAYLFAHNDGDGEFGESGDQDIIKCGSYTGNGSTDGPEIDLGFEPQYFLVKNASSSENWVIFDVMRGMTIGNAAPYDLKLYPNTSDAESGFPYYDLTATGLKLNSGSGLVNTTGNDYIYIAIRRPMKTPESGTEVFHTETWTGNGSSSRELDGYGFPPDLSMVKVRSTTDYTTVFDRLRGNKRLRTDDTSAEGTTTTQIISLDQDGITIGSSGNVNTNGQTYVNWNFRRAPGFFDVVAYTGNSLDGRTVDHNLKVVPELLIVKSRSSAYNWRVLYYDGSSGVRLNLNDNSAGTTATGSIWGDSSSFIAPTSTQFTVSNYSNVNLNNATYIAYLFASLDGISKVGSYTGNGTSQTIDCGFSTGARFVLLKRYDVSGYDWQVFDTERGITSGNDAKLALNTTAAESTLNWGINPNSSGFEVTGNSLNESGGEWIFLAIA